MTQLVSIPGFAKGSNEQPEGSAPAATRAQVVLLPEDSTRVDDLGKMLEAKHKGEFRRPQTISRALDALARELNASTPDILAQA